MRALVKYAKGPGLTELRDLPDPEPGPGEALVRVEAAAVCASDVHILRDRFPYEPPLVLGHEFCGIVERAGPGAGGATPGQRVVCENNPAACGTCRVCASGYPNLCPAKRAIGFRSDGCFAGRVKVPAGLLHRVPAGVPASAAALSEPLAVAVQAVEDRCGVQAGDTVVVLGPGAIGLLAAQVARAEGAARVLVAGTRRDAARLAAARGLGFEALDVDGTDLPARVRELTGGIGADVVVECSGAEPAIGLAARLLRRAGRMAVVGITGRPAVAVPWDLLVSLGASVLCSYGARRRNWVTAMGYLGTGRVDAAALVTRTLPLERWAEAFAQTESGEGIRVLLEP